jgi:hypothetical protein
MAPDRSDLIDLLDIKMLPAWVKESAATDYSGSAEKKDAQPRRERAQTRPPAERMRKDRQHGTRRARLAPHAQQERDQRAKPAFVRPEIMVRFFPEARALENVIAQIRAAALAYSLFSLARLFLQKPQRYQVQLAAKADSPLFQLGEHGAISIDRQFLESNAFRFAQWEFYKIDTTQTEPIKGNFTSVARDRLSGIVLGPTNHHSYQPRLRSLYEQRFSRRMSFADYQRQIQIVADPALVEQWKEEACTITTYTTLRQEPPLTFSSAPEAERHFRKTYFPGLMRTIEEARIDGVRSRQIADRVLRRFIEHAWAAQYRSPSQMMQELATGFRDAGLHIFRHRRGMLFVSPTRVRAFAQGEASVSPQVQTILRAIAENPRTSRKELADKLIGDLPNEQVETRKLALAADLRWLIAEGYVIEFNDGALDLPRIKQVAQASGLQTEQIATETLALP